MALMVLSLPLLLGHLRSKAGLRPLAESSRAPATNDTTVVVAVRYEQRLLCLIYYLSFASKPGFRGLYYSE